MLFNIHIKIANVESLFLFRILIMFTVLLFIEFLIFSVYNMMLWLVVILLIRLTFEDVIFVFNCLTSFWNDVLFSVCCGGLLEGRLSRTAVWVFIKILIILSLKRSSFCKNSYVVLENFIGLILLVNSLIKGFHKAINFFWQGWEFALYIALQSRDFCLIFPSVISGCRIIDVVSHYIIWMRSWKGLVHWRTSFSDILSSI